MDIRSKLDHIYEDIEHNVTKIYARRYAHIAIDVVYHSPLELIFQGQTIKGYPELLIVGDTRSGKTNMAKSLTKHYGFGAIASGEGATFAGLVGGLTQIRHKWLVQWGKIPMNHRRLLFIDEVTGLKIEEIALLSQIRSAGIAELTKIQAEKTNAKTRLIWLTNVRDNRKLSAFSSGIEAIQDVIGLPEDIARFDFAIIMAENDVDYDTEVNIVQRDDVPHIYTTQLCHTLLLWAWSRKAEHVVLGSSTVDACYQLGKSMYHKYSSEFPLVNPAEQKYKLARLATGLACRLFSTDDGERVIVTPDHVEFMHAFLNHEYDRPAFGYAEWSSGSKESQELLRPAKVHGLLVELGPEVARQLLNARTLRLSDVEEMTGRSRDEAKMIIAQLLHHRALQKPFSVYYKTTAFTKLLKEFLRNPVYSTKEF